MKNFKYILVLLVFITNVVWAQNPNNHWQLGNSDVNFSTNPPTVSTSGVSTQYGNASISDDNGNLLFYTDGKKVWNKNHQIMQNSENVIYNYVEAEQPVIIVPYPENTNKYYIFFELSDNYIGVGSTDFHRYKYSIVDFTSNPLGQLEVLNWGWYANELSYIDNQFNYSVVEGLYSRQGGLTYTKNNANDGYWILVNGRRNSNSEHQIYAFNLSSSGLSETPVISNWTSSTTEAIRMVLKVSPDNNTLGLLESYDYIGNTSRFYTFNFNSTTGQCISQSTINVSSNGTFKANSFEFSSDSQKVYFAKDELLVKDLSTPSVLARTIATPALPVIQYTNNLWHIQRDKYDNIVLAGNGLNYLSRIGNQDSFSSSVFSSNYVVLNNIVPHNNSLYQIKYTIPQLIPVLSPPCPSTLVINSNISSGVDKKQASVSIEASNTVNNGFGAIYHAPVVLLKPNFNAKAGSTAHLYPIGCTGTFIARQSQTESNIESEESEIKVKSKVINVSPNPNNGIFKITINDIVDGTIVVTDLYGFTVFKSEIKNQKEFEMNLQSNPKGIYVVKIISGDTTYTEKVIKN